MAPLLARCAILVAIAACGSHEAAVVINEPAAALPETRLPRAPGVFSPSLVTIAAVKDKAELTLGEQLADVDSCATCHPDAAAQWSSSAHSFASFGNPIYRANVERLRADLGKTPSRHCGGCHDLPLLVDGLMTSADPIPANDLRSHSGVSCRLCHGVQTTTHDGNASFVLDPTPIDAPDLGNAASIAMHKRQVTTKLDGDLCSSCHRGFLSPDLSLPVHLTGVDEPGMWRSSAWTGNGMARIDKVEQKTCIDCHMERVPATADELGAKSGTIASHRFVGGHTWMASMRDDAEQLRLTRAKLEGAASIDVAGARIVTRGIHGPWRLPADGAPITRGTIVELDVVIRNLLVGHRFPGGVLDAQDTWVEVEVTDRRGRRLAASGITHATDADDEDSHVLRTLVVDDYGHVLEEHEVAKFRAQIATHTIAPREAQAVRYAFAVPPSLAADQVPLAVTARLRHRSRSLKMQAAACASARTPEGAAFIEGARQTRDVEIDPCKAQPITLVAETRIELGRGATVTTARPAWQRIYEHGMALVATVVLRQEEPRAVLEAALRAAPDPRSRAMVSAQLGWVAAKQGRADDAVRLVRDARELLAAAAAQGPVADPPVLDAIIADAFVRLNRWQDALAPAKACTERAPENTAAWGVYAKVLVALGEHTQALAAAIRGLELNPRDPELLRSQATALLALKDPRAQAAETAYVRFRIPDEAAGLRVRCIKGNERCMRLRNPVHSLPLRPER
ncbi:MAG: tetratricopeptide repeat protein [Deltaproteobacteria bacterium]|nr:tetratricopeptide repeat protein [Deltaproteobacteria bacterium]